MVPGKEPGSGNRFREPVLGDWFSGWGNGFRQVLQFQGCVPEVSKVSVFHGFR